MEIFEKRGQWCFRDEKGTLYKFSTKAEAEVASGVSLPLPEVREYDSLEVATSDQDKDELDRYEDELIAEED